MEERPDERAEERPDERAEERPDERAEEMLDERFEEKLEERLEERFEEKPEEIIEKKKKVIKKIRYIKIESQYLDMPMTNGEGGDPLDAYMASISQTVKDLREQSIKKAKKEAEKRGSVAIEEDEPEEKLENGASGL